MAGFTTQYQPGSGQNSGFINNIGKKLKDLSRLGMKYDDLIIKNSKAIGVNEDPYGRQLSQMGTDDDEWNAFAAMSLTDSNSKKTISIFDEDYERKREQLRTFSMQDEIDEILDRLTDETIVFDNKNFFCYAKLLDNKINEDVDKALNSAFKRVYNYFGFHDGQSPWSYFRKWLIDGYLSFEIIYDDPNNPKHIIGFKELDPITLTPSINAQGEKIWIQNKDQGVFERTLLDSQVIYISYSNFNAPSRVSYVERLVKPYNILKIMEHTRIIWAVTNASYKMKFVIPVGGKSKTRAKQSLAQVMHNYREQYEFDYDSAELIHNGKPHMQFNREYWVPSKNGESPEIESIGGEGPEISDTEALQWFNDKLKSASKIPFSRFDSQSPASYEMVAEGMQRDEMRFGKFVNRLRSIFQEIIMKPVYIEMILKYPALKDDENFKTSLALDFNKENIFTELLEMELTQKRVEFISTMRNDLTEIDEDGEDIPYFDMDFLIHKYGDFTEDDMQLNAKYKEVKALVKQGYKRADALRILDGESKRKFKRETTDDELDDELGL